MQVGKGAVAPKKVYRFPSPASQPLPEAETAVTMHLANDWVHQPKYGMLLKCCLAFSLLADKLMEQRESEYIRQRETHPRMIIAFYSTHSYFQ
jgi:hypothetical protein